MHYHSTPHMLTNKTPAELFLGRRLRTVLDLIHEDTARTVEEGQAVMMEQGPKARREFSAGDNIYYLTDNPLNRSAPNWSPGLVISREANKTYKIHAENGDTIFRHEDHTKGRCEPEVHINNLHSDLL